MKYSKLSRFFKTYLRLTIMSLLIRKKYQYYNFISHQIYEIVFEILY